MSIQRFTAEDLERVAVLIRDPVWAALYVQEYEAAKVKADRALHERFQELQAQRSLKT